MSRVTFAGRWNLDAIETAYQRWRQDPTSVDESWRLFFEGFELGQNHKPAVEPSAEGCAQQAGIIRLIDAYRRRGHVLANLDPLNPPPSSDHLLELSGFGLGERDLDKSFDTSHFLGLPRATLRELLAALRETYCRTIGAEYMHIQDRTVRTWLQERIEPRRCRPDFPRRVLMRILMDLHHAEVFEKFLHTRFLGQKRFSLEGAETLIPLLDYLVELSADGGVREMVLGMAHRGRLNVLANILHKPYKEIFSEFEENYLPNSAAGDGDVKYHLGFSSDHTTAKGGRIHLSLTPNPSHLEAVNPVVEGRVRAKQTQVRDEQRVLGIPVLIHGDAAVAGQGLVAETLNLSQLQGYRTGGTLHIVINNQIGFTTRPSDARSTRYCTDVAKMIEVPIFHVNSEDPEALLFVAELALAFRQTFHKDVFIDMYCYRKHGHNEGDEPAYTNPLMTAKIEKKPSLSQIYGRDLIKRGVLKEEENNALSQDFLGKLNNEQQEMRKQTHFVSSEKAYQGSWAAIKPEYSPAPVKTGVPVDTLKKIADVLGTVPPGFEPNDKIKPLLESRRADVQQRRPINWGLAESLAFGSLLLEGTPIRLSGQDSCRGTFSQRHSVLYDKRDEHTYIPLNHLSPQQAPFAVYDSLLSEAAVLGFEFGFSLDSPGTLVLWEAQFGDFANGAQVIVDQFIAGSKSKWQRDSGLVMLLPHGYEGQGPEHSSARLERYLQLCAEDNLQVCYPSTPAQYFHLLRRQVRQPFRRPLIVMTPKSLLRHKAAVSEVDDLSEGHYREVVDDPLGDRQRVRRIVLCSGKVYYDLVEQRARDRIDSTVIVRLEQFYPFPRDLLQRICNRYPRGRDDLVWAQEESQNMGGWFFVEPRLRELGYDVKYVGRDASASTATGSRPIHLREQMDLVKAALSGRVPFLVSSHSPHEFFQALPKKDGNGANGQEQVDEKDRAAGEEGK
jgi:2-oxoglutarate dehydrogenase E1 component